MHLKKQSKSLALDVLNDPIRKVLVRLALPIMATSLIQMAYNLTDIFWVGKLGSSAVAAVGTGGLFLWLADSLMHLARMGGQVQAAQAIGAGDLSRARKAGAVAFQIGISLALLFGLIILLFHPKIIHFFHFQSQTTIDQSHTYLTVTGGLVVFSYCARIFTGLMTAAGNSKTPFRVTAIGLICNMVLDPLLIFGLNLGVLGAALATVISQAFVVLLFFINRKCVLSLRRLKLFTWHRGLYRPVLRVGIPTSLETLFYSGTSIVISHFVARYGDFAVAAQRIGSQIESLSWLSAEGMASAVNACVAQHVGANMLKRANKVYRLALTYMGIIGFLATLILYFFADPLMRLFVWEPQTIHIGAQYLSILAISEIFMGWELMSYGAYAGYGDSLKPALIIMIFTAIRIPLALLLTSHLPDVNGIWWAITISSILKGTLLTAYYPFFRKRFERKRTALKMP